MTGHALQRSIVTTIICAMAMIASCSGAYAASEIKGDVDVLSDQIKDKQLRVRELDGLIRTYKNNIDEKRNQAVSLQNQLAILENRIKEKELSIERAKIGIEALTLEIKLLTDQIRSQKERIAKQKELIAELVRNIHNADEVSTFDVLLTQPSLSAFFLRIEEIYKLQRSLTKTLEDVKEMKVGLEQKKQGLTAKQTALEDERRALKKEQLALEAERNLKTSLVSETQTKEQEFTRILYELRQQQQNTADDISALETQLKEKLNSVDQALARGDILLNWPVSPAKGITSIFHDPSYPFRSFFEHPGTDIRAGVGTIVRSAAGGYVAWNKKGRLYGNYLMIVHPGGIATVYAHLSKFLAAPDTYVERQEPIALSGGRPGDPGAGLSTGPHLHFEVREDGVPVDPENFLPSIPNDYYDYYEEYKRLKIR
jgi:murein DD-endopeptidase MepM/ murein hydrolase activator NlpD